MEDRPGSVARADAVAGRRVLLAQLLPAIAVLTGVLLAQSRPGLEIRSFDTPGSDAVMSTRPPVFVELESNWVSAAPML